MFLNIKICVITLSLCLVVLCDSDDENIKVRSTKRSPISLDIEQEPLTKFQAALEENTPKGRSDHERKITARKGVPNEVPELNDTSSEPLPADMISDKEKLQIELHVTTLAPLAESDKGNVAPKHRPREGVDEMSPEIKNSSSSSSTVSIDSNETKNQAKSVNDPTKNGINSTKTDTTIKASVENATQSLNKPNMEQSSKNTSTNNSATSNNINSSASITSTTTIATTTNTTESPAPTTISANDKNKKSNTTYVGDQVELEHKSTTTTTKTTKTSDKHSVDEPLAQLSKETKTNSNTKGHRDYIIPVVALIFIIPIILGALLISYRRLKDYWSTRHYRRMDFLVDGMYND